MSKRFQKMNNPDRFWTFTRECPHCGVETSMRMVYYRSYPVGEFNEHYFYQRHGEVLRCLDCDNVVNLTRTSIAQYAVTEDLYTAYDIADDNQPD